MPSPIYVRKGLMVRWGRERDWFVSVKGNPTTLLLTIRDGGNAMTQCYRPEELRTFRDTVCEVIDEALLQAEKTHAPR